MTVSVREKVSIYIREHGCPSNAEEYKQLYDLYPNIKRNTLQKAISRLKEKGNYEISDPPIIKKSVRKSVRADDSLTKTDDKKPENQDETPDLKATNYFSEDIIKDINKLNAMKQALGGDVNIKDVIVVMKELDILKPTKEVELKESLRNEPTELIISLIMPEEYIFTPTPVTTFDKNELASLIKESDL